MRSTPPDTPRRRLPLALDLPAYGLAAATLAGFAGGWHWLFDLASHFPWYWLLAGLAWFALAARRCSRPATACLLATVAVNAWALLPYWLPAAAEGTDTAGGDELRIVSLNVLADNADKDRTLAYLRQSDADVVVLLEVDDAWAEAVAALEPRYPHGLVHSRADRFGIAVLSRLPLANHRVEKLAAGPPVVIADLPRGAEGCLLVAAHPPAPIAAGWSARRDAQLAAIGDLAATERRPVIVAGDLNATPWSHGFQQLVRLRGLRDSALGRGLQATWNARLPAPRIPIDHVIVSPEVRVVARRVGPDVGSDHLPVEATLAIP
jgi:endonuclease/exonuclease/phosphatase (EEP) superfamily protein YafD